MANELVSFEGFSLPCVDVDSLTTTGGGGTFRKRLQLVSSGKLVNSGKVVPGNFIIPSDDDVEILGTKIVIIPLAMRDKALDTNSDQSIVNFDPKSTEFKRIVEASEANSGQGYMYGPSLLCFEQSTGNFLEYFMMNASARSEADVVKPFLPISRELAEAKGVKPQGAQPVTLSSKLVTNKKNQSWYVPKIRASSETFDNIPSPQVFVDEILKFYNEKSTEIEKVEAVDGKRKR